MQQFKEEKRATRLQKEELGYTNVKAYQQGNACDSCIDKLRDRVVKTRAKSSAGVKLGDGVLLHTINQLKGERM